MDIDNGYPWPRHGARWTAYDYRTIITGLQHEQTCAEIARAVGRTVSAVRDRAHFLVERDEGAGRRRGNAWRQLRDKVAGDPSYDWEGIARRRHAEAELPYWDESAENRVRAAWSAAPISRRRGRWRRRATPDTGMDALSVALRTSEMDIAERIVELGLSTSYAEIVDRLGCRPDGALALRAVLARAEEPVAQFVLVAAGEFGDIVHVSLHADRAAADRARGSVEARFVRKEPVLTRIVRRVPGRLFGADDPADDRHSRPADRNTPGVGAEVLGIEPAVGPVYVVDLDGDEPPVS